MTESFREDAHMEAARKVATTYIDHGSKFVKHYRLTDRLGLNETDTAFAIGDVARHLLLTKISEKKERLGHLPDERHTTLFGLSKFLPSARFQNSIWMDEFAIQVLDKAKEDLLNNSCDAQTISKERADNVEGAIDELFKLLTPTKSGGFGIQQHQIKFWEGMWKPRFS